MLHISKRTVAMLSLAGLLSSMATVTAHAESQKTGFLCGFTSVTDPTGQANTQTGEIDGGPVTIVDDTDPTIVHTGHLTCTVQVGSANSTHAGADAAVVSGPDTPLVVDVPPSQLTYTATADDNVYLCTSITTEEGTWYFDDPNDPTVNGSWSTSNTVDCGLAISASTPGGDDCGSDPVCSTVDFFACIVTLEAGEIVDGTLGPIIEFGPDGDIYINGHRVYDCPPYFN